MSLVITCSKAIALWVALLVPAVGLLQVLAGRIPAAVVVVLRASVAVLLAVLVCPNQG
jgi:hypothetical protein